ncbi:MAG: TRC40/GET3/ArsA family transport-energizing ATPase, partial [Bacilli bacterium]
MKTMDMTLFSPEKVTLTRYLFFTGKGGVGKTSTASAFAVNLASSGAKVLLISTDPASNLQDVFNCELNNVATPIEEVPNLFVANFNPNDAVADYIETAVGPYRGKLPTEVIASMEEQLMGSCTMEIAAFNEFTSVLTNNENDGYDHIIFDTAPTGHTLRLLSLPGAWNDFLGDNPSGASCLGPLSTRNDVKDMYYEAVQRLCDAKLTTVFVITRPENAALKETIRASKELHAIGMSNQQFVVNGMLLDFTDEISESFYLLQQQALQDAGFGTRSPLYFTPLHQNGVSELAHLRTFFTVETYNAQPKATAQ